jgi:hypothetical protein
MKLQIRHYAERRQIDLVDPTDYRLFKRMFYDDDTDQTKDVVMREMSVFACGFRDGWDECRHTIGSVNFDGRVIEVPTEEETS